MSLDKGPLTSSLHKDGVPQEEASARYYLFSSSLLILKGRGIEREEVFEHGMNTELVTVMLLLV